MSTYLRLNSSQVVHLLLAFREALSFRCHVLRGCSKSRLVPLLERCSDLCFNYC